MGGGPGKREKTQLLHHKKPPSAFKVLCKFILRKEFLITLWQSTLKVLGGIGGVLALGKKNLSNLEEKTHQPVGEEKIT